MQTQSDRFFKSFWRGMGVAALIAAFITSFPLVVFYVGGLFEFGIWLCALFIVDSTVAYGFARLERFFSKPIYAIPVLIVLAISVGLLLYRFGLHSQNVYPGCLFLVVMACIFAYFGWAQQDRWDSQS